MKTFWAALLAFVAANVLLFLLTMIIFASTAAFMGGVVAEVKSESVLHIDLTNGLSDSPSESAFKSVSPFGGIEFDESVSLYEALCAIDRAADDDKIKGIYINVKGGASVSHYEELRAAVERFKESGKFVVAYNEAYSQGNYYLSSVADKLYVHPEGGIAWTGLSASVMFYKGLMEKLGVEMEILRHGTFKSAVEPFMLKQMSDPNRLQYEVMLNSIWGSLLGDISRSREIDSLQLSEYASTLAINSASDAVSHKMADATLYDDQMQSLLKKLIAGKDIEEAYAELLPNPGQIPTMKAEPEERGKKKDKAPNLITLSDYVAASKLESPKSSKNRVAIIYADGSIIDGESSSGTIGGHTMIEKLAKVRKDSKVKAVVLRVNSPGGSALASDLMWREVDLIAKEKPIIVSMGDYAASGGYYISCAADAILADRTTLTGSIGVFGMMPYLGKAMEDKLGLTVDVVRTNPSADMGNPYRRLGNDEREAIMKSIREIYGTFVNHVAEGRNMTFEAVDNIGEGRVWAGANALEIGLIDAYGGLYEAIALAADRAGLGEDFNVWEVVETPDDIFAMLRSMGMVRLGSQSVESELGEVFKQYKHAQDIISEKGVQARMPYTIELNL